MELEIAKIKIMGMDKTQQTWGIDLHWMLSHLSHLDHLSHLSHLSHRMVHCCKRVQAIMSLKYRMHSVLFFCHANEDRIHTSRAFNAHMRTVMT